MQKGQCDHTAPTCHLHQVYCPNAFHNMIPLTPLSLSAFNQIAKLSQRDQDKHQEKHKKRNRKTIEGQISYSSSLLKGEGPHGSISLQTLPTGLSCNSSYVDSGMCWIPPWTNLTHLKQQESNLGRVFFLCWPKELDLFKEGSKQESESANRGDKTRQFKTERVSDVYFHFP